MPRRLGEAYVIQQSRDVNLALDARERLRGGDGDPRMGVKPSASRREQPRLFVRGQQHVERASGEEAVDRFKVAERIGAGRRASMDALGPPAEPTETDRIGIENLDVVTGGSQDAQELACREAGCFRD